SVFSQWLRVVAALERSEGWWVLILVAACCVASFVLFITIHEILLVLQRFSSIPDGTDFLCVFSVFLCGFCGKKGFGCVSATLWLMNLGHYYSGPLNQWPQWKSAVRPGARQLWS